MTARAAHPTILVVDDDGDVRATLAELLREEGYVIAESADGREAEEYLRSTRRPPASCSI